MPKENIRDVIDGVLAESFYFGATRSEHAQNRQEGYPELIQHLKEGRTCGNSYLQNFAKHGIENFDYAGFIYRMDSANRVPTLQEHFIDAQDETPLPIWRPMICFKYPEGLYLTEQQESSKLALMAGEIPGPTELSRLRTASSTGSDLHGADLAMEALGSSLKTTLTAKQWYVWTTRGSM